MQCKLTKCRKSLNENYSFVLRYFKVTCFITSLVQLKIGRAKKMAVIFSAIRHSISVRAKRRQAFDS